MSMTLAELREAFSLTGANNALPLVPKVIDRLLFEGVRKYAPLRRALPRSTWETDQYIFNSRLALPRSQMTTEAPSVTDVQPTASSYTQKSFPIKHQQTQLDISLFTAQVAKVNGDLFNLELSAAARSHAYLEEILNIWGSAGATNNTKRPQWDGIDLLMSNSNKIDAGGNPLTPKMLDDMIDSIRGIAAAEIMGGEFFFLVSGKMESSINRLFTQFLRIEKEMTTVYARDDYGMPNGPITDNAFDPGIECVSYRGVPIVISSFQSSVGQMTTVTAAAGGTGSSFGIGTNYYVVEAVSRNGLSLASTEVSQATTAGQNVTLTWTTPTIVDVYGYPVDILGYRIFRGGSTGTETLYATVSALDANDNPITTFVDTGLIQNPYLTGSTLTAATVAQLAGNAAPDGATFPHVSTGGSLIEDIYLIPRNPEYCLVPVVNEMTTTQLAQINARTRQMALTSDQTLGLRAPGFASKLCRVKIA